MRTGWGTHISADGVTYTGEWLEDKVWAFCVCVFCFLFVFIGLVFFDSLILDNLPWSFCSCMAKEHYSIGPEHIMLENLMTTCTMAWEHTPFLMVPHIKVNFTRTGISKEKNFTFLFFFHFSHGNSQFCCFPLLLCKLIIVVLVCMLHSVMNSYKQICKMFSCLSPLSIVDLKERVRSMTSKDAFGLGHFPALKRWDWNCSTPTSDKPQSTSWSIWHCNNFSLKWNTLICLCVLLYLSLQLCPQLRPIVVLTLICFDYTPKIEQTRQSYK